MLGRKDLNYHRFFIRIVILGLLFITSCAGAPPRPERKEEKGHRLYFTDCMGPTSECAQLIVPTHVIMEIPGSKDPIKGSSLLYLKSGSRNLRLSYKASKKGRVHYTIPRDLPVTLKGGELYELAVNIGDDDQVNFSLVRHTGDKKTAVLSDLSREDSTGGQGILSPTKHASELKKLTSSSRYRLYHPRPSPDGRLLAFEFYTSGGHTVYVNNIPFPASRTEKTIVAMKPPYSDMERVIFSAEGYPGPRLMCWWPDGSGVVGDVDGVVHRFGLNSRAGRPEILYDFSPRIPNFDRIETMTFSPDGNMLWGSFQIEAEGRERSLIFSLDLKRKELKTLGEGGGAVLSPDGEHLAFIRETSLFIWNVKEPFPGKPVDDSELDWVRFPAWSPDGSHLVFREIVRDKNIRGIGLYRLKDGAHSLLATGDAWIGTISWSRDGFVYFTAGSRKGESKDGIWRLKPNM